jgi:hypothetical protein
MGCAFAAQPRPDLPDVASLMTIELELVALGVQAEAQAALMMAFATRAGS